MLFSNYWRKASNGHKVEYCKYGVSEPNIVQKHDCDAFDNQMYSVPILIQYDIFVCLSLSWHRNANIALEYPATQSMKWELP